MKGFWKENFVLILGISLPVLLILFVMTAQAITRIGVAPPQYGVVFASPKGYAAKNTIHFHVNNGVLSASFKDGDSYAPIYYARGVNADIVYYNPHNGETRYFNIAAPDEDYEKGKSYPLAIPDELAQLTLIDQIQSPDGYEFMLGGRYGGNPFSGLLFSGSSGHYRYGLSKNGVFRKIDYNNYRYHDAELIGWVSYE